MTAKWISRFSIWFYFGFFVVSLLGYTIFRFNGISVFTILLYFVYVIFFLLGISIGSQLQKIKILKLTIKTETVIKVLLPVAAISVVTGWLYMIRYYGDIPTIISHAFNIREETIGNGIQIIPTYVSYLSSFGNAGFVLSVARYCNLQERKDLYYSISFGLLILLLDLQSFGRVGILFVIFVIIGCILLFRIKIKFRKLLIYGVALLIILMLPRWIRGGSSLEGVSSEYSPYLLFKLPSYLDSFVSLYAYYFSGIFSFDELLNKDIPLWFGERNFSSLINLFNRFLGESAEQRITIIAPPVYIPYKHNIYMILGEAYMDFGLLGLVILPIFFGLCIGYLFRYKGIYADALKLVLIGWIFYTPIYNLFSFGSFMLAYIVLVFLTISTIPLKE